MTRQQSLFGFRWTGLLFWYKGDLSPVCYCVIYFGHYRSKTPVMNQRALIIAIALFVAIVGGMFAYAYVKRAQMQREEVPTPLPVEEVEEARRIDAKHFFSDGTHTIAGEVLMPTPCDLLEADTIVRESSPEQVTVAFSVVNNAEMCAQVVTPQRFKASFDASAAATIDATWEGEPAVLNLIDAGPNESPDDFELFIKG